jgi:hypothetical protein
MLYIMQFTQYGPFWINPRNHSHGKMLHRSSKCSSTVLSAKLWLLLFPCLLEVYNVRYYPLRTLGPAGFITSHRIVFNRSVYLGVEHCTLICLLQKAKRTQTIYVQYRIEARSCSHFCKGKEISIAYLCMCVCVCVCVFVFVFGAFGIQQTMRVRRIIFQSVSRPALQNCSTLSYKRHKFRKKVAEHKTCFDFSCYVCLKHFSFQEELSEIWSKLYIGLHVKYYVFLSHLNETWIIFFTDFRKIIKYPNFVEIFDFRNIVIVPKNNVSWFFFKTSFRFWSGIESSHQAYWLH